MDVIAWPGDSENPYIPDLYDRLTGLDPSIRVTGLDPRSSWRRTADIVHVHWPEAACSSPSLRHALAKSTLVLATLAVLKARGASIVWTCHNLTAHEHTHPRLERFVRTAFERLVDGVIHLDDESIGRCRAAKPHLAERPAEVIAHGHYRHLFDDPPGRADARRRLGIEPDATVLAAVGQIRTYKNIPALVDAFSGRTAPGHLIIAGAPRDDAVRADVENAAAGVSGIHLDLRWLSDDDLVTSVRAADAVLLPYRDVHNSGAAILALSLGRPVAITDAGTMASLARSVGSTWVHLLGAELDGEVIDRVIEWARSPRHGLPDLQAYDPDAAATRTAAFFRRLAGSHSDRRTARR